MSDADGDDDDDEPPAFLKRSKPQAAEVIHTYTTTTKNYTEKPKQQRPIEPLIPTRKQQQPRYLIFGFVGRIDKFHKGLDLLIEGYKIYKEQNGKAKLWIVGDGQDLEYLKKYTKENNLQDFVTFFGSKFGNEKLNLMKNMDVFIHTSRFEGFPMAILESFGLNVPILISDETNVGEYVTKYSVGILLKENTPSEISKEMLNLNKNIINQWKENIPNMVSTEFMWPEISKRIVE